MVKEIKEKHAKHDDEDKNAQMKMSILKKKNNEYSQQLSDLKEIKSSLSDQKNKEIKKIEQKQFDAAMKFYKANPKDVVASFLMDTMNQFIGGSAEATHKANSDHWKDAETIQAALRNADCKALDKNFIREKMNSVTGCSGIAEEDGEIFLAITDQAKTKNYLNFFCFFKIVSKMCHLGMTQKKEEEMKNRCNANNKNIAQMEVKIRTGESIEAQSIPHILSNEH